MILPSAALALLSVCLLELAANWYLPTSDGQQYRKLWAAGEWRG